MQIRSQWFNIWLQLQLTYLLIYFLIVCSVCTATLIICIFNIICYLRKISRGLLQMSQKTFLRLLRLFFHAHWTFLSCQGSLEQYYCASFAFSNEHVNSAVSANILQKALSTARTLKKAKKKKKKKNDSGICFDFFLNFILCTFTFCYTTIIPTTACCNFCRPFFFVIWNCSLDFFHFFKHLFF